ncbi:MAG: family 43 glycosylhydrolase [Reichenbachiella sp.]
MKRILSLVIGLYCYTFSFGQIFEGTITDVNSKDPLNRVSVFLVEENKTVSSNENGFFTIKANNTDPKTLRFELDGYMFEELFNIPYSSNLNVALRPAMKSTATLREESYISNGCDPAIPNDPNWNVQFKQYDLKGDLAPNSTFTRRDPSAVISYEGKYYVWYSYSLTHDPEKTAPWDLNDLYFSTSIDGETWTEQGIAIARGPEGAFDHRSVFTTEIFVNEGKYYLVYQAAADQGGVFNRNFVGMAHADSPDGPWTKLDEPVLRPTYTDEMFFDNNAVHDPCIIKFGNEFRLYYKGECNCFEASDCQRWCNPVCSETKKQVKWGVAIGDTPIGPFVKSTSNPITNTGHEVMVWNYNDGVAILQHQDGPEAETIQFARDGLNFEIKGSATNLPEAAGLYRPNNPSKTPHGGIQWGLNHKLKWDDGPHGWMYIKRFEIDQRVDTGQSTQLDTTYFVIVPFLIVLIFFIAMVLYKRRKKVITTE